MSFVRPEARAALWRVREMLAAAALGCVALWLAAGNGLTMWLGYASGVAALVVMLVGLQRARFRTGGGGPGVVAIDEGQVAYFGPLSGGVVALSEMQRLWLDPGGHPAHWVLEADGAEALYVPVNAEGTDALFDAFTALPGLRTARLLEVRRRTPLDRVLVWQRGPGTAPQLTE